jgi:hypothetical protein
MRGMRLAVFVALILGALCPGPAVADVVIYNDQAAFLAATAPGYYEETFDSLVPDTLNGKTLSFSQSGFSYTATTTDNFVPFTIPGGDPSDVILGTDTLGKSYSFNFLSGNVTAVGGFFFDSDFLGNVIIGDQFEITIDGLTQPLTVTTTGQDTFVGFVSSTPFTTLTVTSIDNDWVGANDLIVGTAATAVPEPATNWIAAVGGLAMLAYARRRRRPDLSAA